ncbi:MAG TPA: DUF480 domain-containing protein [Gemmataceae bacterium]|nr:DUF480 domain-containing protein [Gemmataceae bacterium]
MSPETSQAWPVLGVHERRVLGVLVEKAMTTQDAGPLSLNSVVTGSNQKSNRDPLMNLDDVQAEQALVAAQQKGLVSKIQGSGRVERWKHNLYDVLHVSRVELGIIAELLLRGPQTEGELRGRASRMEPIADVDALRGILRSLVERKLAVYLTPEGRRGTIVTHGFHAADELEHLRARQGAADAGATSQGEASAGATQTQAASAEEISDLRATIADLQKTVGRLEEQLAAIKQSLGV